jgi:hypothetical protein
MTTSAPRLRGFGLIDVIVGIALMLIMFMALFGLLRASLVLSSLAKAKATAVELANTQMEYLHGLSYDALGTVGGIPAGLIPQATTTAVDGVNYTTHTFIEYYDDPADGTGANDETGVTTDYKSGKVTVSYSQSGIVQSVALVSNFVPPGVESTTGGGTLSLHIVDATGSSVNDASVRIVNASTVPAIDFVTFSNSDGLVTIGGAATSSAYEIYVSKVGYSSAQAYERTGVNVDPTPGYLTVSKDQTTNATFAIDQLGTLTFSTISPAVTTSFSDSFPSAANLLSQSDTKVTGGELILTSEALSGSAHSISISPTNVYGWGILDANVSIPSGTGILLHLDDALGNQIPDTALPGNSAGFTSFPVSLTDLSTSTYPSVVLEADLLSDATSTTPALESWSLSYTAGPLPVTNIAFTLTGDKSIGTNASGIAIHKTITSGNTGASGAATETLEWDAYELTLTGSLIESCPTEPFTLSPAQVLSLSAMVGTPTSSTLPLIVTDTASTTIANATIVLSKNGYAATVPTDACGLAYFNGLADGIYSATVTVADHPATTFPGIDVAAHTPATTLVLP